jgi:hypothetical protein
VPLCWLAFLRFGIILCRAAEIGVYLPRNEYQALACRAEAVTIASGQRLTSLRHTLVAAAAAERMSRRID